MGKRERGKWKFTNSEGACFSFGRCDDKKDLGDKIKITLQERKQRKQCDLKIGLGKNK